MENIKVLFSQKEVAERVCALGKEISDYYKNKSDLVLGVLSGCFMFAADLIREMKLDDIEIRFIKASSYTGTQSSGKVDFSQKEKLDLSGRNVLIVEDIVDTGKTLAELKESILSDNPADVKIAAFLNKPSRRITDIFPDFCCFDVPDRFVVGYGLDCDGKYRQLPYLGYIE